MLPLLWSNIMTIKDLTFNELANCRILARKESHETGRVVTFQEVAEREISKHIQGKPSFIYTRESETQDNIGKYMYLEFDNGDCKRVHLVESSDQINPDMNVISTSSPMGRLIKFAKKNDIYLLGKTLIRIVDIAQG